MIGSNTTLVTSNQTQVLPIVDPVSESATESELEPLEAIPKHPSPRKRAIASVASTGRRVVYARRRLNPQPSTTTLAAGGPPPDPEEPEPPARIRRTKKKKNPLSHLTLHTRRKLITPKILLKNLLITKLLQKR